MVGYVIRDYFEKFIKVIVEKLGEIIVKVAEAIKMRNRVREVIRLGYKSIYIRGDSVIVR